MGRSARAIVAVVVAVLLCCCTSTRTEQPANAVVPNVEGLSLLAAQQALTSTGLRGASDLSGPCPPVGGASKVPAVVVDQQPRPGSAAARGSLVHLHVC
jgi:beta-lactam-binding protein with PASTA domain